MPRIEKKRSPVDPLAGVVETLKQQVDSNPGLRGAVLALTALGEEITAETDDRSLAETDEPSNQLLAAVTRWERALARAPSGTAVLGAAEEAVTQILANRTRVMLAPRGGRWVEPRSLPNLVIPRGEGPGETNGVFGDTETVRGWLEDRLPSLPEPINNLFGNRGVGERQVGPVRSDLRFTYQQEPEVTTKVEVEARLGSRGRKRRVRVPGVVTDQGKPVEYRGKGVKLKVGVNSRCSSRRWQTDGKARQTQRSSASLDRREGTAGLTAAAVDQVAVEVRGRRGVDEGSVEMTTAARITESGGRLRGPGLKMQGKGTSLKEQTGMSYREERGRVSLLARVRRTVTATVRWLMKQEQPDGTKNMVPMMVEGQASNTQTAHQRIGWGERHKQSRFGGHYQVGPGRRSGIERQLPLGGGLKLRPGDDVKVKIEKTVRQSWRRTVSSVGDNLGLGGPVGVSTQIEQGRTQASRTRGGGEPLQAPRVELNSRGSAGADWLQVDDGPVWPTKSQAAAASRPWWQSLLAGLFGGDGGTNHGGAVSAAPGRETVLELKPDGEIDFFSSSGGGGFFSQLFEVFFGTEERSAHRLPSGGWIETTNRGGVRRW